MKQRKGRRIAFHTTAGALSLVVLLCIAGPLSIATVHRAEAQSSEVTRTRINVQALNDFVVEPGKMEIVADAGQRVTRFVSVTSRIPEKRSFVLGIEDYIGTDDKNNPVQLLGSDDGPYTAKDILTPALATFDLDFGEKITIPISITIPANAEPRGYYGAVVVAEQPKEQAGASSAETEGTTRIVSRVGVLFLVRVNGEANEAGALEDFSVMGPDASFFQRAPEGFEIVFHNTGSVHLVPHGIITIENLIGSTVATLPVDAYFALPDSRRYRDIVWKSTGFMFGRYTATLEQYKGYGGEDNVEAKTVSFWIVPLKLVIPVAAVCLFLGLLAYYILTRFEIKKKPF